MTMIKAVEPQEWATFLNAFTGRNRGRGARFELFGPHGGFKEEEREAALEDISIDGHTITVKRHYVSGGTARSMTDEVTGVPSSYGPRLRLRGRKALPATSRPANRPRLKLPSTAPSNTPWH